MGVVLAAALPLQETKEGKGIRVALVCLAVIGTAAVQFVNDRTNDAGSAKLLKELANIRAQNADLQRRFLARQLEERQDRIRKVEAESREVLILDPRDTLVAAKKADRGFLAKAELLALRGAAREAQLLAHSSPSQVAFVLEFPDDASARLKAWRVYADEVSQSQSETSTISAIIGVLTDEVAYRRLADIFHRRAKPEYTRVLEDDKRMRLSFDDLRKRMNSIAEVFARETASYEVAGRDNQLGVLAMACGQRERALAYFYQGLVLDQEHIPLYQSLAYTLWVLNGDSFGALEYADKGLKLTADVGSSLKRDYENAVAVYATLVRSNPALATAVDRMRKSLDTRYARLAPVAESYADFFTTDLKLQYAYYSALEVVNQRKAQDYVDELYRANPRDAEYEDARGFVLMRFHRSLEELYTARQLFVEAIENGKSERITPRLANLHLKEVQDEIAHDEGRSTP